MYQAVFVQSPQRKQALATKRFRNLKLFFLSVKILVICEFVVWMLLPWARCSVMALVTALEAPAIQSRARFGAVLRLVATKDAADRSLNAFVAPTQNVKLVRRSAGKPTIERL